VSYNVRDLQIATFVIVRICRCCVYDPWP